MAQWELAVDATALRPCAATAEDGRLAPLELESELEPAPGLEPAPTSETTQPEPDRAVADVARALRAAAARAAAEGRTVTRLVLVHPAAWVEPDQARAAREARAAGLPDPVFVTAATALARYFRARLALPDGSCLAVYDARTHAVEAAVLVHAPAGLQLLGRLTFPGMAAEDTGALRRDHARRRVADETAALLDEAALGTGRLAAVYLTGRAAQLPGAAGLVRAELGVTVFVCDRPEQAAALGALLPPDDAGFRLGPPGAGGPVGASPDLTLQLADSLARFATEALAGAAESGSGGGHPPAIPARPPTSHPAADLEAAAPAAAEATRAGAVGGPPPAVPEQPGTQAQPGVTSQTASSVAAPDPAPGRRRVIWLSVGIAAVVVGGACFLLLGGHSTRTPTPKAPPSSGAPVNATATPPLTPSATPSATDTATETTSASPTDSTAPSPSALLTPSTTPSPSASPSASASPSDSASPGASPSSVVLAYYDAINKQDFATAWQLGGRNLDSSYSSFVQGYSTTARDDATAQDTGATQCSVALTATHTDGSVQHFTGVYTVVDGAITAAQLQAAS
ncbi:hypothetical protein [Kitasatospora sp. LaBMicrA B282]|uniref:hypothetical protein n=1 Tax=Kitasatospora sp. LaBMicrA B282 TaxID=3420949 RepID=UPI003D0EFC10